MTADLQTAQLLGAGAHLLPALVWAIVAVDLWSSYSVRKPRSQLWRLLPFLASAVTGFFTISGLLWLLPADVFAARSPFLIALFVTSDGLILLSAAMLRHASLLFPLREQRPSARWLAVNYAAPLVMLAFLNLVPGLDLEPRVVLLRTLFFSYIATMVALSARQIARYARRGVWRPGGLGELRYADVFILGAGLVGISLIFLVEMREDPLGPPPAWAPFLGAVVGLALVTPFVVRRLAETLRRCLLALSSFALIVLTVNAIARLERGLGEPELGPLFDLGAIFLPALVALCAQSPLRNLIDRVVLRRNLRRRAELRGSLLGLPLDKGITQCCRRALGDLVEIMRLRGAAVALESEDEWIVEGPLEIEPLRRLWRSGMTPPAHSSWAEALRELSEEQQEAFIESDVTGTVPIVSPRRRWGHLLFAVRGWSAGFADDDVRSVESFADEFALALDTAELLERAVSVERSLAHSEKLAAIGELSARVAHEIRNPVTAARSLAQQLLREPTSPFREEHELILQALERVERQVAALLRFARRDEFHFAPVDLGALARRAAADLAENAAAWGIALTVEAPAGVVVRGDSEKLRQVLVNLCENGIDALRSHDGQRRIELSVARENRSAVLRVADTGPGVEAHALPRLFEAFYSGKEHGTGLGLAIVQRIVEAHGGAVTARNGAGMVFEVSLPTVVPGPEVRRQEPFAPGVGL